MSDIGEAQVECTIWTHSKFAQDNSEDIIDEFLILDLSEEEEENGLLLF